MAKKKSASNNIVNRRARHDYALGDELVVGVALTGPETKALRLKHGQLQGAYVTVKDNELWLVNASIIGGTSLPISETEQTRTRKLLAKQREINSLIEKKQQGNTIIPLEILTRGRYIKLRIAVGRGKKRYDKRQALKKRDQQRQIDQTIRKI